MINDIVTVTPISLVRQVFEYRGLLTNSEMHDPLIVCLRKRLPKTRNQFRDLRLTSIEYSWICSIRWDLPAVPNLFSGFFLTGAGRSSFRRASLGCQGSHRR
ncbi:MAG: hypothetical protein WCO86_08690, partial [Planctomycetota bacterium]